MFDSVFLIVQGLVECIGVVFLIKDIQGSNMTLLVNVLQEMIQRLKKKSSLLLGKSSRTLALRVCTGPRASWYVPLRPSDPYSLCWEANQPLDPS